MASDATSLTARGALLRALSYDLRCLRQRPTETVDGVNAWYFEAQQFRIKLDTTYKDISGSLPHELEHYLDDADIRAKDAGYRSNQEKFIDALLDYISAEIRKEQAIS